MKKYVLIESRDPHECRDWCFTESLAENLIQNGNEVIVFLVENGVFPVRPCSYSASLTSLMKKGVQVWADDFSLVERGITKDKILNGIKSQDMDAVVYQLCNGYNAIWH